MHVNICDRETFALGITCSYSTFICLATFVILSVTGEWSVPVPVSLLPNGSDLGSVPTLTSGFAIKYDRAATSGDDAAV